MKKVNLEKSNQNVNIQFIRIIAAYFVVVIHVSAKYVGGIDVGEPSYETINWWVGVTVDSFSRWSVPVFAIITGYLVLEKSDELTSFYFGKFIPLVKLILFWSALFVLWSIYEKVFFYHYDFKEALSLIVKDILAGRPYYHLWYLTMLVSFYLFLPFIRALLSAVNLQELKVFLILVLVMTSANQIYNMLVNMLGYDTVGVFSGIKLLEYLGYFIFGYYFKITEQDKKANWYLLWCLFIFSIIFSIIATWMFGYKYVLHYTSPNVVIMSISIFYIMYYFRASFVKKISSLGYYSLGVYILHPIFISILERTDYFILAYDYAWIYILALTNFVFILSLLVTLFLKKTTVFKRYL
ncbi:TPA: acyltransferase family protein [Vibrio alginolyticus]|nr:acyltransferase family protein [Vibrio alginolyticus]